VVPSNLDLKSELIEFLWRGSGLGRKAVRSLSESFDSLAALRKAWVEQKESVHRLLSEKAQHSLSEALERSSVEPSAFPYITHLDPLYPAILRKLYDPPCVLYYRGNPQLLYEEGPRIGVIGTRYCTYYAQKICVRVVESLESYRPVIVSGMALGIDGIAHQTALRRGMKTLGVLGTSIDQDYPLENVELFREIEKVGLLLSELSPDSLMAPWRFPERNRIIAALVDALIVVEAPEKSGALVTAKHALELGKEIYVVPGPFDSVKNRGGHRLIQEGANLLIDTSEIFQSLQPRSGISPQAKINSTTNVEPDHNLSAEEKQILQILMAEAQHVDKIVDISHLPAPLVSGLLMQLCIKGRLRELPGKVFDIA
jgi:DNA processing protein